MDINNFIPIDDKDQRESAINENEGNRKDIISYTIVPATL